MTYSTPAARIDGGREQNQDEALHPTLSDASVTTPEPRCALCPLCRCHTGCQPVDVEAVSV